MEKQTLTLQTEHQNKRLDKILSSHFPEWSRTQIQEWMNDGNVVVNGKKVKANYKGKEGDFIEIFIPPPEELEILPEEMDLDIFYEDEDVLVVNKPKGMVVHPAPGHLSGTLVNGLLAYCDRLSTINGDLRPGIVHRIDKDTSGLLMVAKNDEAHLHLVNQLKEKLVLRKYLALVHGNIPHNIGKIDAPIGRDPKDRQKMAVVDHGKEAITHFRVLERFDNFTFVECKLETGRTHQIRVHMKYIGYPLAGDPKYGPKKTLKADGQVLHASILGFYHPKTEEFLQFEAPLPEYYEEILSKLRKK